MRHTIFTLMFLTLLWLPTDKVFAQTCAPTPSGLVSWYRAEGNTVDSAGGNNGTLEGNTTYAAGKVGQAFSLDGNGDRVVINNPTNLQLQNLTIEGWIKRSSSSIVTNDPRTGFNSGVFFSFDVGGYGFIIDEPTGRIALTHNGSSAVFSTATVTDTNYHHIAVTKSGNQVVFYVDGAADAPVTFNDTFTFASNTAAIGTRGGSDLKNAFFGQIDELSIYNRALTPAEIQSIVAAGSAGKCKAPLSCTPPPSGIAAWLPGDGNANDISGNGDNGTIQGNVTFAAGKVGQTFRLGGTGDLSGNGDRVIVGNPANLQLQDFTIEAWIRRASSTVVTNSPFAGSAGGTFFAYGQNGYGFAIDQNTSRLGLTNIGNSAVFSTMTITDTNFHHVAVTKSGNQVIFYVDGVADAPVTYNTTFSFTSNAAIGARGDSNVQNAFFGDIDELTIYNRALSAAEIQAIVAADSAGKCKNAPTAAAVSVSGRVATAAGRGISKAMVSATDGRGNVLTTLTNSFGFYSFAELPAGDTYIFSVRAKRYQFAQPSQVLSVTEDQTDVNFTAFLESNLR